MLDLWSVQAHKRAVRAAPELITCSSCRL